ncbi:hypothetical protein K5Q02_23545 [Pseudomonas sp. MM211]|uniref:hypothetical protein n=1 Tax=Pseudomonas sp. MM211 TaxID=2866808 RepID=UPI001CEC4BE1|nr:hypothetical protein [Pseudomonas sp. MM211]UCJ16709.1 hypothetical protein K5Q02_23545 [Pseudomonas sp. MM211]
MHIGRMPSEPSLLPMQVLAATVVIKLDELMPICGTEVYTLTTLGHSIPPTHCTAVPGDKTVAVLQQPRQTNNAS